MGLEGKTKQLRDRDAGFERAINFFTPQASPDNIFKTAKKVATIDQ